MSNFRTAFAAGAIALALATPAAALTTNEVLVAMDVRIVELGGAISFLQGELASLPPGNGRAQVLVLLRQATARRRQLVSLKRIVPRYPEQRLDQLVQHYGLDVSPA